jgi:hypothetical protein
MLNISLHITLTLPPIGQKKIVQKEKNQLRKNNKEGTQEGQISREKPLIYQRSMASMLRRRTADASQQKKLSRWEATIAHNAQIDEPGDMLQPSGVAAPGFASASDLAACRDPAAAFRILCENGSSTDANQVHT